MSPCPGASWYKWVPRAIVAKLGNYSLILFESCNAKGGLSYLALL